MRKLISLVLILGIILALSACGNDSTKSESIGTSVSETDSIETILQGSWSYHDETGFNETFTFSNGDFRYKTSLDNIPGAGSDTGGSYEIGEGYITLIFENDFINRITYERNGDDLTLSVYSDSGADAGTTRIYEKDYGYINIPDTGNSQTTTKDEPSKDTSKSGSTTSGMRNALKSAKNYLSIMPFSYEGLIEQLEFEGYSHLEAVYGADNCDADWYEQAVKSAENYLDIMSFSYEGLIEQLEYEGFTHDQAVYGADKAY